jgi:hypothetical protein
MSLEKILNYFRVLRREKYGTSGKNVLGTTGRNYNLGA